MSSQSGRFWLGATAAILLSGTAIWQVWPTQPVTQAENDVADDGPVASATDETPVVSEPEATVTQEAASPVITAQPEVVEEPAEQVQDTTEIPEQPTDIVPEADVAETDVPLEGAIETEAEEVLALDEAVEEVITDESEEVAGLAENTNIEAETLAAVPAVQAPSLDTFRVENDGQTLLAGRAGPNEDLAIMVGGEIEQRVTTDGLGTFVAFLDLAPSDQSRSLTVVADPDGAAVQMAETFFIEPFGAEEPDLGDTTEEVVAGAVLPVEAEAMEADVEEAPAVGEQIAEAEAEVAEPAQAAEITKDDETVAAETTEDAPVEDVEVAEVAEPASDESVTVTEAIEEIFGETLEEAPTPETVVAEEAEAPTTPAVPVVEEPTILVSDEEGVRVAPVSSQPQAVGQVMLDTITYDPKGEVVLGGRASTDGFVQVYIDNQPITTSRISRDQNWSTDLPEIDTGVYTLRIDELDAEGDVVSRIETPFKREEPETVIAAMAVETAQEDFEVAVKTVQPGATLWAIAREKYGEGILYVAVYEANQDLIRDPDLIYPGQIFVLPELEELPE